MKKAMLYIMTACLSLMFAPEVLNAANMEAVKTEVRMETPVKENPVTKVDHKTINQSPDPVTKNAKETKKWTRDAWIIISGGALLILIILLIILL